jgi:cobalt-zinc-cadmium efflux system outer membrane protein
MKHIKSIVPILFFLYLPSAAEAQERALTFESYMEHVRKGNLRYLAEQYNVDMAEAALKAATVFPDPELSVGYANNQHWKLQMGYGVDVEASYTLELGGKRRARISVARSEKEVSEALLEDYFRNLRADAALAYLAVLRRKRACAILQSSYLRMLEVSRADSVRHSLGAIAEVDARQSRLEAASMLNEVYAGEGALREVMAQLMLLTGGDGEANMPDSVAGELSYPKLAFDLDELLAAAQANRADLRAAEKAKALSHNSVKLAKANRAIDLGVRLGGGYSAESMNEIAPAPAFTGVTAGISIPLKFSSRNRGEWRAAQLAARQQELACEAMARQIRTEVMQVYHQYIASCRQVEQFHAGGLLDDAEAILKKKLYSYERGETGILEALNAQRTYSEVQMSYGETLYNCAAALVELERACGVLLTDGAFR